MPLNGSHGRLAGSGAHLWLKERINNLRIDIRNENTVTILPFRWVNGGRIPLGAFPARIARTSNGGVESNEQTTDSHLPVVVLTGPECAMETDHEFTSPSYPGLLFRVKQEVIDFNAGPFRRYECEAIR